MCFYSHLNFLGMDTRILSKFIWLGGTWWSTRPCGMFTTCRSAYNHDCVCVCLFLLQQQRILRRTTCRNMRLGDTWPFVQQQIHEVMYFLKHERYIHMIKLSLSISIHTPPHSCLRSHVTIKPTISTSISLIISHISHGTIEPTTSHHTLLILKGHSAHGWHTILSVST